MVSAAVDGELPPADVAELGLHTETCEACRDWLARVHRLARVSRLGAGDAVPGPDQAWKRRIVETAPRRRARGLRLRVALVAVALAQLAVTLPFLLFGRLDATRDQGALDVALAVGLLVVASRPWRAVGLQTFLGVAALLLIGTETIDLLRGDGEVVDLGRHLLVLASWWIVWSLARAVPQMPPSAYIAERSGRRRARPTSGAPHPPLGEDGRTEHSAAEMSRKHVGRWAA